MQLNHCCDIPSFHYLWYMMYRSWSNPYWRCVAKANTALGKGRRVGGSRCLSLALTSRHLAGCRSIKHVVLLIRPSWTQLFWRWRKLAKYWIKFIFDIQLKQTLWKLTKKSRSMLESRTSSLRGAKITTQVISSLKYAYVPNSNNKSQTSRRRETSVQGVEGSLT